MSINVIEYHNLNTNILRGCDELLPCPFCGTLPEIIIQPETEKDSSHFVIYCPNNQCSAIGDCERCYCHVEEMDERQAIKRWNNRLVLFISTTDYIEKKS